MYKIVFRAYLRQKWIDVVKLRPKWWSAAHTTYRWVHFNSENASFCDSDNLDNL